MGQGLLGPWQRLGPAGRLLMASAAGCVFLAAYMAATETLRLGFLPWNLFLAWVPYGFSGWIRRLAGRTPPGRGVLILPTALWLLFFPNAPYVITDFVHLRNAPDGLWLPEALLIGSFALVCLMLGMRSLRTMHGVVSGRLGSTAGWVFSAGVLLLTGVGVWIGRVLRLNSWDALTDPGGLVRRTVNAMLAPWEHLPAIGFSLVFGAALFLIYATPSWARALAAAREGSGTSVRRR